MGTILRGEDHQEVTVLLDNKAWPMAFSIGKKGKYALSYADQSWKEPKHGQLVMKAIIGTRVVRSFAELNNGRNRGTIFDVDPRSGAVRIVWHETEKVEKVCRLPDNLRYMTKENC